MTTSFGTLLFDLDVALERVATYLGGNSYLKYLYAQLFVTVATYFFPHVG